jgi:hypothetical protein
VTIIVTFFSQYRRLLSMSLSCEIRFEQSAIRFEQKGEVKSNLFLYKSEFLLDQFNRK